MRGRRALSSALLGSVLVIFSAWSDSGSSESSATIPAHSASALQSTTVTSRPASQPPGSPKDPPLFFTTPKRGAVVSTSGRIDYTVDGGSHWRQGNGAHNAVAIDFVDSLNGWAVTARYSGTAVTYGPLLHTTDGGASWSRLPVPPEGGLVTVDFTDDLVGYGLTSAGTLLFTNDRGEIWRRIRTPVAISDLCFVNDLEGWIAGGGTIYFLNAGVLTTSLPKSRVGTAANVVPTPTLSCAGQTVWADYVFRIGNGNASTVLVRSLDGGTHWKVRLSEWYSVPGPVHGSEFDAYTNAFGVADSEHAWFLGSCLACQYGEISMTRTKDGGAHFSHTFVLFSRRAFFTPGAATFIDATHGWVLVTEQTEHPRRVENLLLATDDGGAAWHILTRSAPSARDLLPAGEPEVPTAAINANAINPPPG